MEKEATVTNLKFKPITDRLSIMSLNGTTLDAEGKPVDLHTHVSGALKAASKAGPATPEAVELVQRACNGDREAQTSLNELRVERINNFVYPQLTFGASYFKIITLGHADRPVISNETKQEIRVGFISQDGEARCVKLTNPGEETMISLKTLSTEKYGYRLEDIYNGDIANQAEKNYDVAFDLANQIDKLAFELMTASLANGGVFGAFTLTGNKVSRVYVPHSRIVTSNLPDSNDLTVPAASGSTDFSLKAIRTVIKYCDQWGGLVGRPTGRLIVPAIDATALADEIVPTGSTNNAVADQMLNGYTQFDYLGVRWQIYPDITLQPKQFYAVLGKPIGTIYTKPSMERTFEEINQQKNWGERSMRKVIGFATPSQLRLNALRVRYRL